jgi:predicted lipoprotein with Yx(FWY)xxD motif
MTSTGLTLYVFSNDAPNVSNCVGQCLELWPAFFTDRTDVIAPTVEGIPGTFGTFPREDGTFHITYNEQPLYFYSQDAAPGDVNGQGVGDVWFVVPLGVVSVAANDELGSLLTDTTGFTLYTFSNDTEGVSNCIGQCLELWPAFTVGAESDVPAAVEGIPGEFGVITRDDGTLQVTRNGQPLYFYSQDAAPGDVTGQGVGNVWFVVALDTVQVSSTPELGNFLVGGSSGFTLYTFANDEPGWSNCVGECAANWPPLVVDAEGAVFAPPTVAGTFATTLRADGTYQVTLDDKPLYFFSGDAQAGETNGNGAGGTWSVASVTVTAAAGTCELTVAGYGANLRQGPGTEFEVAGQVAAAAVLIATGQLNGADGFIWWQLDNSAWIRTDVVTVAAGCEALPVVSQ